MSRIYNEQHAAAHQAVKSLLSGYLQGVSKKPKPFGFQAIAYDNTRMSRYEITIYKQSHIQFTRPNTAENPIILATETDMPKILELANNPNYEFSPMYDCAEDIREIYALVSRDFPDFFKKCIVVGEVQLKINDEFIPGTRHISWFHETKLEFDSESKICLQHMSANHHEVVFNKIAELWLNALLWKEGTDDITVLNTIMADLQFYFGQALFFYRGSPTICKILMSGTYYEQGFLPQAEISATDTYCTAEYYPFIGAYRNKFLNCYGTLPTAVRTQEFIQQRGKFSLVEEAEDHCKPEQGRVI